MDGHGLWWSEGCDSIQERLGKLLHLEEAAEDWADAAAVPVELVFSLGQARFGVQAPEQRLIIRAAFRELWPRVQVRTCTLITNIGSRSFPSKLVHVFLHSFPISKYLKLKHTWGVHHIRSYLPISTLQEALLKLTRSNEMMACAAEEIFYLIKQQLKIPLVISPAKGGLVLTKKRRQKLVEMCSRIERLYNTWIIVTLPYWSTCQMSCQNSHHPSTHVRSGARCSSSFFAHCTSRASRPCVLAAWFKGKMSIRWPWIHEIVLHCCESLSSFTCSTKLQFDSSRISNLINYY